MFENRVLRGIFVPKREELTEEWRKLHNEELNDLYCSPKNSLNDKIVKYEMGRACSQYEGEEKLIEGFCGET
jgi:hypothetical protein